MTTTAKKATATRTRKPAAKKAAAKKPAALEVRVGRVRTSVLDAEGTYVAWFANGADLTAGKPGRVRVNLPDGQGWVALGRVEDVAAAVAAAEKMPK